MPNCVTDLLTNWLVETFAVLFFLNTYVHTYYNDSLMEQSKTKLVVVDYTASW